MPHWESILTPFESLFLSETMLRLMLAAVLGALVGLERQFHHRPAGLRDIMLITVGSALFTLVLEAMAKGVAGGDPLRAIGSLITGIGFMGAGSIIHARGAVVGLTTAATIFVMASIGMACGAGLYAIATFSTILLVTSLLLLRRLEQRMGWKARLMTYTANTRQLPQTMAELNMVLDKEQLAMQHVRIHLQDGGLNTVEFSLNVPEEMEKKLMTRLGEMKSVLDVGHSERMEAE